MIKLYTREDYCCGCTACVSICPRQAITMKPDKDGFLYPTIDDSLCTECGLCKKVCAFQNNIENPTVSKEPLATYAAILKNQDFLKNSTSGGAFVALALHILNNNGVVFGCAMGDDMQPEHICIDNMSDIKKLQGSKYVQSDLKNTFLEAKKHLQENRQVLFTGTPCQIAGIKSYLGKDYDNLITAGLICHGVPSSLFFKGYITWLERKLGATVTAFKFRDKAKGWGHAGKAIYKKGRATNEKLIFPIVSYYYHYFLKGDICRKSCYECPYAGSNRPGDFTIGDYWGIEKIHPDIETKNGVSLILLNSKKGLQLIDNSKLSNYMCLIQSNFEKARVYNGQLNYPTPKSDKRDIILKTFREYGFQAVADKYYSEMKKQIMLWKIKTMIPKPVKNVIKKILGRG